MATLSGDSYLLATDSSQTKINICQLQLLVGLCIIACHPRKKELRRKELLIGHKNPFCTIPKTPEKLTN